MNDYIVRATAADHSIRAFAITSKNIVEEARKDHNTSPVITAALGRLLSGAAMMGTMMKGEKDLLTVQIQCQGPAQGLTVTADSAGHVKGFPRVADVALPPNALGKLDVGGALGLGEDAVRDGAEEEGALDVPGLDRVGHVERKRDGFDDRQVVHAHQEEDAGNDEAELDGDRQVEDHGQEERDEKRRLVGERH